jgi:hypothetical protein
VGKCEIIWPEEFCVFGKAGHREIGGVSTDKSAGRDTLRGSSDLDWLADCFSQPTPAKVINIISICQKKQKTITDAL